jgi:mRNA interferase MazF
MRRGEVWWADLPEPWGRRPVLLVHRTVAYGILTWVLVAPLTTTIRDMPTGVVLDPDPDDVDRRCMVNLDSITVVRVEWLTERVTTLSTARMREVDRAIRFAFSLRDEN